MDELRMGASPAAAVELACPLLFLEMQMTGDRELGEELGGRDILGWPPQLGGGLALGHAHAVVDVAAAYTCMATALGLAA